MGGTGKVTIAPPRISQGVELPQTIRHIMENALGADFSSVRVHEGHEATMLGAISFTQGDNVHFAPGRYAPHSEEGLQVIGHELAHVVQQRAGRVAPLADGLISMESSLEREADAIGARAAQL